MTLIVSVTSPRFAMQVSDRNLTNKGGVVSRVENKAVLFGNRMSFAFTGTSEMAGVPTATWLASFLVTQDPHNILSVLEHLRTHAADDIACGARLGIVGVGWAVIPPQTELRAVVTLVSNFHDQFEQQLSAPRDEFVGRYQVAGKYEWGVIATGLELSNRDLWRLRRQFRHCVNRKLLPLSVSRIVAAFIRSVADDNFSVGHDLMVSMIPRTAIDGRGAIAVSNDGGVIRLGPDSLDYVPPRQLKAECAQFAYMGANSNKWTQYTPVVVKPGELIVAAEQFERVLSQDERTAMYLKFQSRFPPNSA